LRAFEFAGRLKVEPGASRSLILGGRKDMDLGKGTKRGQSFAPEAERIQCCEVLVVMEFRCVVFEGYQYQLHFDLAVGGQGTERVVVLFRYACAIVLHLDRIEAMVLEADI
jgi:hypothetical protein